MLGPTRTHAELRRIAGSPEAQTIEQIRCEREPWYWFVNYMVTQDEHWVRKGLTGPYQRFPALEYLRSVIYVLWQYDNTAWPKSRQMRLTWAAAVGYVLGEALFRAGRLSMVQSKKEEDAQGVLRRTVVVYDRMRQFAPWLGPNLVERNAGRLTFSNDSAIVACPQGAHHVQSYTPARLVLDEIQLQDEAEEAYHQALPATESMTLLGSADYGWFWQVFLPGKLAGAA